MEDPPSLIGVQAKQIESLHTEANKDLYFGSVWISKYRYKYKKNEKKANYISAIVANNDLLVFQIRILFPLMFGIIAWALQRTF